MQGITKYINKAFEEKSDKEKRAQKLKRLAGMSSVASITGRGKLEICGCRGIITYKDDLISVRLCDGVIKVIGASLHLCNFYGGRMIIRGKIESVSFCDR